MTAPVTPRPFSSAQEIAESLAHEVQAKFNNGLFDVTSENYKTEKERYQIFLTRFLSAITAAVAQTKEGEEPIFRTLLRRLRDSIDECDSEELLQEVDEALELKEPSPESNLSTQKALEFIREIQINALDASRLPGIQFSEKRTCPFCNAIMEPRGDFTHRPDAGQWTSHPRNDCILAGMWFHPAKWNKRV